MMLPYQVTMIPVFLIFTRIGWANTLKPLWIGAFFAPPFYLFLLRQFFLTIPRDLEDAAKIDGCSYFGIYSRIMLPLIRPAITSVVIFQFMAAWNDFMGPLIYIQDRELATLSPALQAFRSAHKAEWSLLMAGARSILSTHWNVSVESSASFCIRFYEEWLLNGLSRAQAWRKTVLSQIDNNKVFDGDKAYSWAAFSLAGDWR